jgi:Recombinase zinc beta ribbon domain
MGSCADETPNARQRQAALHRGEPRVQCSTYRQSGSCTNSRMVHRRKIEAAVLDGLREVVGTENLIRVDEAMESPKLAE